jgi:hypothetical protein
MSDYREGSFIERKNNEARIFFDINRTYHDASDGYRMDWNHSFNSEHIFKFYLDICMYSETNGWIINNVDWSKGLLVVSDTWLAQQWAHVYYYDINGNARKEYFKYKH